MTEWEVWIVNNHSDVSDSEFNQYDMLLELAVDSYDLKSKSRKMDLRDRVTFVIRWWRKNKEIMRKYNSLQSVADLLNMKSHASVDHHIKKRKVTANYEENVKCIKDFLES